MQNDNPSNSLPPAGTHGPAGAEPGSSRRLYVKTFGCQMNEYDSEKVVRMLSPTHTLVDTPAEADVVYVNTCSVREKGEHKLFSLLGELRDLKKERPSMVIGVGGCVAQQEGAAIAKRNSAVDFVVGTHNLSLVPALVGQARERRGTQVAVDYREEWESLPLDYTVESNGPVPVRALVSIQRGCNKRCAFCVVPFTRGEELSRDADEIVREVALKVRAGSKEVLLLGQTVNSYGRDLTPRIPFDELIRRIAAVPGLRRIRFTSPHPAEVRPAFIELYKEIPALCPHIHLPLQSGSDRVLKLMNRNYRLRRYLDIVAALREARPDIAISTDLIVGFPTETEDDFQATLRAMEEVGYAASFSFKYSPRPNTKALTQFRDDELVSDSVAHERLLRLQELQDRLSVQFHRTQIGRTLEVLVENAHEGFLHNRGRIPHNTWCEVEGLMVAPGTTVKAEVVAVTPNGLRAKLASDAASGEDTASPAGQENNL